MTTLRVLDRLPASASSARSARHRSPRPRSPRRWLRALLLLVVASVVILGTTLAAAAEPAPADAVVVDGPTAVAAAPVAPVTPIDAQSFSLAVAAQTGSIWTWPTADAVIRRGYEAPAQRYGVGHRGIDLDAAPGTEVRSVDDGVVRFAGMVAGRPVVSVDHGNGLVSSFEPVIPGVVAGQHVDRGQVLGMVGESDHCEGCLHLGARLDGEYLSPLALLGGVPRAVLLPLD